MLLKVRIINKYTYPTDWGFPGQNGRQGHLIIEPQWKQKNEVTHYITTKLRFLEGDKDKTYYFRKKFLKQECLTRATIRTS